MRAARGYLTWERGGTGEQRSQGEVPAQAKKGLSKWPELPPDGMTSPALGDRKFPVMGGLRGQVAGHLTGWLSFVLWGTGLGDCLLVLDGCHSETREQVQACQMTLGQSLNSSCLSSSCEKERIPVCRSAFLSRLVEVMAMESFVWCNH